MNRFFQHTLRLFHDIWQVFVNEVLRIFHDGGVVLIFIVATLLYPLIFGAVYHNEMVRDLPIAVVDQSQSTESSRFRHKLDATPELNVAYDCNTMQEAEQLMRQRLVKGIVYFPQDYATRLAQHQKARVGLFCDISSFLNYRSVYTGASNVLIDEMHDTQITLYGLTGITGQQADELVSPIPYDDIKLYNSAGGFTSFLVPALLVLVIHQTLVLGIGIINGTANEHATRMRGIPYRLRSRRRARVTVGRALAYLGIYLPLSAVVLLLLPRAFGLPHIGQLGTLTLFVIPFLLASIFFAMTVSCFVRERDSGILCTIFFSVILLFLSGIAWPQCQMPAVWRWFGYLFPSTPGIQCFVRINSMGARLSDIRFDYLMLWGQAIFYFFTSCIGLRILSIRDHADTSHSLPADSQ